MPTTTILDVTAMSDHEALVVALQPAADALRNGELVIFPTETVYGLGANARSADAVSRIFRAKGRPATDPVIVHIAAADDLGTVADPAFIPPAAYDLIARFWPGPLTLVLRRQAWVSDRVTAGGPTVGVRVPAHPVAQALLHAAAVPIAAPSANRFARPSPTTAQHALSDLEGRAAVLIDGGPTAVGIESTVLDLSSGVPRVLRPGGVPLEALRAVLADVVYAPRALHESEPAAAPGMMLRHYAPQTPLTLVEGGVVAVVQWLAAELEHRLLHGEQVGIIAPDVVALQLDQRDRAIIGLGGTPQQMARNLYAAIRDADALGLAQLYAVAPPPDGVGVAIRDRLFRAAEGHVLHIPPPT